MACSFIKGDIFDEATGEGAPEGPRGIAFGADCDGAMTTGIASAFQKRWPALGDAFAAHCATGKMQLGDVFTWRDGDLFVYALGVQRGSTKPRVSIFERALRALVTRASEDGVQRVLLPRIGAGKGGMDWIRVKRVITDVGQKTSLELVVFEQFIRQASAPPRSEPG
ncbi:MAG: macro domain-containing protein [Deltaproteobacteria bacterium]|nr:macro domain-containing protein [Deltaproteobacteria bacterium]